MSKCRFFFQKHIRSDKMYGKAKFDEIMLLSYTDVASCYTVIRIGSRQKEIMYQNKERLHWEWIGDPEKILYLLFYIQFES